MSSLYSNLRTFWNNSELWEQYGLDDYYVDHRRVVESLIPVDVNSILDVGTGKGEIIADLGSRYQVVGLDISPAALAYVRCPRVLGTVTDLPFADKSFDLVMCLEVIEHLPDDHLKRGVEEIQRVAKK
jgi:ubiquinone/menaquinone biosynthesis C-methylase UbiE